MPRMPLSDISLRISSLHDHPYITQLHRSAMGPYVEAVWGWDDKIQAGFLVNYLEAGDIWIIERGELPVGSVQFHIRADYIFLSQLEIDPAWQGMGIGSHVIRLLQQEGEETVKPLRLQVLKINMRAQALYLRMGFVPFDETATHVKMEWPVSLESSGLT